VVIASVLVIGSKIYDRRAATIIDQHGMAHCLVGDLSGLQIVTLSICPDGTGHIAIIVSIGLVTKSYSLKYRAALIGCTCHEEPIGGTVVVERYVILRDLRGNLQDKIAESILIWV